MRTSRLWLAVALVASLLPLGAGNGSRAQEVVTELVVTNNSNTRDGDTSSVAGLTANPGDDGISLFEAIEATNNDPGLYTIRFDPTLVGTIIEHDGLPVLRGGNVEITGDIDGDDDPDVTLRPSAGTEEGTGLAIGSSGNRLHALTVRDFNIGAEIGPSDPEVTSQVLAHNAVTGMVILDVLEGIKVHSAFPAECPDLNDDGCETFNTFTNTTISGNTLRVRKKPFSDLGPSGIVVSMTEVGDAFEHATVTDNVVENVSQDADRGAIQLQTHSHSRQSRISDVLIARNELVGGPIGIEITAGANRAQATTIENLRIIDNRVHLVSDGGPAFCCQGIVLQAGGDSPHFAIGPPVRYLDDNVVRDVVVRGNTITGTLKWGVQVTAGFGNGGRRNRVRNVRINGNVIRTSLPTLGVWVVTGDGNPYRDRYATNNLIALLVIRANRIRIGTGPDARNAGNGVGAGGIALVGGGGFGRENVVRNVKISRNAIRTAYVGIRVYGGRGRTARKNRVICVPLSANRITGARKRVSVRSNVDGAVGNRARRSC